MDSKLLVGKRIAEARIALGISQVQLSKITGFGKTRISNWETGFRSAKPNDAKTLEKHLNVSAGYLLGITDSKAIIDNLSNYKTKFKSIPILTEAQLLNIELPIQIEKYRAEDNLPLAKSHENLIEQGAFAFELYDNSMFPEFNKQDTIVFIPTEKIKHNDYVLVRLRETDEIIFRKYCHDNSQVDDPIVNLEPINNDWLTRTIKKTDLMILGVMSGRHRLFL